MREQKGEKSHDFRENVRVISQIQATRGRDAEHFIKIFRHEGDNVASATLGTMLGIFEIDDSSEDSKYIVNFLFSVAKNEYFCNPRRGATESFEAALHKINVALAEIVKHGNIRWLGKLHGTIAILERNSIHLSAAGDGRIYLSRNNALSHISEGLASPEAMDRPLKTFIEISSGQLIPGDRILFLLPKAVEIISEPVLARHAGQMTQDRLNQFLRTAMINKLDRGGAIVVDIEEAPAQPALSSQAHKKTPEKKLSTQNYFSETAFEKKRDESIATALAEEQSHQDTPPINPEYTDTKTGHIYIQGDKKEPTPEPSRIAQYSESFFYFSQKIGEEGWRKSSQLLRNISLKTKFFWLTTTNRAQGSFTLLVESSSQYLARKTPSHNHTPSVAQKSNDNTLYQREIRLTSKPQSTRTQYPPEETQEIPLSEVTPNHTIALIRWILSACTSLGATLQSWAASLIRFLCIYSPLVFRKIHLALTPLILSLQRIFLRLSYKGRLIVVVTLLSVLSILIWVLFQPEKPTHLSAEDASSLSNALLPLPSSLRSQETNTRDLPPSQVISQHPDTIASTYLNSLPIIMTQTSLEIPSKQLSLPLPDGNGLPKKIAPMQDLDLLFFLTDTGTLMTFSPVNKTFSSNALPTRPDSIDQISTYLTYLYVLNADGTMLFRYPRAQGGFGEGTPWLKQNLDRDPQASFALNESVFIFSKSALTQYSQGKTVRVFETPKVIPNQLLLATEPENTLLLGLDTENERLIAWDAHGQIIEQYFSETLKNAISLSLNNRSVLISTPTETFEIILP